MGIEPHVIESGACINSSTAASQQAQLFLNLALAGKEREVFVVMFLDAQYSLIEVAELFLGTLDEGGFIHQRWSRWPWG